MLGAIIGDIVGSRFEFANIKTKDFGLFGKFSDFTDDTVMTVAVAKAWLDCDGDFVAFGNNVKKYMIEFGRKYPHRGYGTHFGAWLHSADPKPYGSYGNGAAMRISPVGFFAESEQQVRIFSYAATSVTHNHKEGIKGAEAISMAIFWARHGKSKQAVFNALTKEYYPELASKELTYPYLLEHYNWGYGMGSVSCQSSVPQAIACFYESESYEDAIRTAVSIGGDSDTIAAMTGGIAQAYYGEIPDAIKNCAFAYLPDEFKTIIAEFEKATAK